MTKKDAFFHLIDLFDRVGIRYALVGDTDDYPDHIGSDVDIVTDEAGLAKFHRAVWSLEECGLRVVQRFQHEITAFYYILAFRTDDGGWDFIQPDICTDYYRRAIKLLDAAPMLDRRRKNACPDCPGDGFCVLAPEDEFAYYLFKKIGKTKLSDSQFCHLRTIYSENPSDCRSRLSQFGDFVALVWSALESGDVGALSSVLPDLKRGLLSSGRLARPARFHDALRKLRRIMWPTGLVVSLPDGEMSGRASVLHETFAQAFRRQMDVPLPFSRLFFSVLKAKIVSSLVVLGGPARGALRPLVDIELGPDEPGVDRIVEFLASRTRARHCPGRELSPS
jgi:hypothetical protein